MRSLQPIRLLMVCLGITISIGQADEQPAQRPADAPPLILPPLNETPSLLELADPERFLRPLVQGRARAVPPSIPRTFRTRLEPTVRDLVDLDAIFRPFVDPVIPTYEEVVARIPVISSADPGRRSIELDGSIKVNDHASFFFRALYRAPDHYAMIIRDEPNGPPILFVADRHLLIYDPVRPALLYSDQAGFQFTSHVTTGAPGFQLLWWPRSKRSSHIALNIPFLLEAIEHSPGAGAVTKAVSQTAMHSYQATLRRTDGGSAQLNTDFARPCPATRFAILSNRQGDVSFLTRIAVDDQISDGEFAFPTREQAAAIMNVVDCSGDGLFRQLGSTGLMLRGLFARLGVRNPEIRSAIKLPALIGIDWPIVERNDRQYSGRLRDVFSAAKP